MGCLISNKPFGFGGDSDPDSDPEVFDRTLIIAGQCRRIAPIVTILPNQLL